MAASGKTAVNKKQFKYIGRNKGNTVRIKDKKKGMKLSHLKKKRLIIRNLSFKVNEEELKKVFSKFGKILEVKIPLKSDGKKKGFAFVEYVDTKSMIKAMKALNFKNIHGRPIAIDFAVNKDTYLSHLNNSNLDSKRNILKQKIKSEIETDSSDNESIIVSKKKNLTLEIKTEDNVNESTKFESKLQKYCNMKSENDKESDKDARVIAFLKEFDVDDELQEISNCEASVESSEDDEDNLNCSKEHDYDDIYNVGIKDCKKKQLEDISEGKTVFIRNISFRNIEDDLLKVVEKFGEVVYCLFCNDSVTGHFRGTAFVKFKEKESAEKFIGESFKEPGILLDSRKLLCTTAISREELSKQRDSSKKNEDKRNLRLLKCGLIPYGSIESKDVSQADMAKRAQLEALKKQKLRNVNFFVSDKRLVCHNVPKNINDKDLHKMFKKAGGKGAVIKEARIMRDFKKTDPQGNPMSRGFAFITFTENEHALKALNELNNNPNIFTSNKRPIVEFSVENKVALLSQERKRAKIKLLNKKRMEKNNNQNSQMSDDQPSSEIVNIKTRKQIIQKKRKMADISASPYEVKTSLKQQKHNEVNCSFDETLSPKKKKKQKKGRKKQKNVQKRSEIAALTELYKEKLLNKFF